MQFKYYSSRNMCSMAEIHSILGNNHFNVLEISISMLREERNLHFPVIFTYDCFYYLYNKFNSKNKNHQLNV